MAKNISILNSWVRDNGGENISTLNSRVSDKCNNGEKISTFYSRINVTHTRAFAPENQQSRFPTRSDTNRLVQSQKQAGSLSF